ncbi:MAG TPA: hemolysin family protein [Verrucomicrobiae bacterium]|nr:hemolysin family protein [Verrucomicrobiae bacterium]
MALMPYLAGVGLLVFAGMSFFFALAESALFSLGKWQLRQLAERSPNAGGLVARLLAEPQHLLATIVLGNTVANASILAITLWAAPWGPLLWFVCLPALLVLILLGCEVAPKTLAVRSPELWALRVARPMLFLQKFTGPFRRVAQRLDNAILNALVPQSIKPGVAMSDEEYQELLELAFQQGTLAGTEKEIILQIIGLDRQTAQDVMKPRAQMAAISDDLPVEEMIAAARKFKHTRLPLYDETLDTIVGVLNARALLWNPEMDLADAIEFPSFVPESMNLLQLLKSLQRQQRGLAIVLDEFGGTAGIVTMQDILEEMVGEIRGEGEPEGFVIEKLGVGRWRVNGTMRLEDFRREYPALGEVSEVDTMGGLMVALHETIPAVGDAVTFRGLKLTAQSADERRVRELMVETLRR